MKPKFRSIGPSRPTPRLLREMFALSHSRKTCRSCAREAGCRSSGSTRLMPRASKPARPSIRAFRRRRAEGTGSSGSGTTERLSSEVGDDDRAFSARSSPLCWERISPMVPLVQYVYRFNATASVIRSGFSRRRVAGETGQSQSQTSGGN